MVRSTSSSRPAAPSPSLFDQGVDLDGPGAALGITELYGRIEAALAREFPRRSELWVRGEVQSFSDRTGHCYIDLTDPDQPPGRDAPVLKVKCWRSSWAPIRAKLEDSGIELDAGSVVTIRGKVDLYRARGEIGFIVSAFDISGLLGKLAAQRAQLIQTLSDEGLLERNRTTRMSPVPLRIGLVASPGTEGYNDFTGQLVESGYCFDISLVPTQVQGSAAAPALATAITFLGGLGRAAGAVGGLGSARGLDLVVVVRGGGSKADLAVFDSEPVARAIANCPIPVWTGIGHTGDQSVADMTANRACITPTDCGQQLVGIVDYWWASVAEAADRIAERAQLVVEGQIERDVNIRRHLVSHAHQQLARNHDRVAGRAVRIAVAARRSIEDSAVGLAGRASRIGPMAVDQTIRGQDRLEHWRRLLSAYDVDRQLQRGYSITLDENGRTVRGTAGLQRGGVLVTRFVDGEVASEISEVRQGSDQQNSDRQGTDNQSKESKS